MRSIGQLAGMACLSALGACAQLPAVSDITTGSILPALPSVASLVPTMSTAAPRPPERVSGNLYRIDASDRTFDDSIQRDNYGLLRAAESAKEVGGSHFVVVSSPDGRDPREARNAVAGAPTGLIRVFRLDPDMKPPTGAISAAEIIHFFGPGFGRAAATTSGTAPGTPG